MRTHAALLTIAALVAGVTLSAQVRYRPTENGPWRPWSFTAIASARQERGATAAEVQAWQARLQQLAAIIRTSPAVAQPVGFAAEAWGNLDGYGPPAPGEPAGKSVPLAGSLSFGAFPLVEFTRNGRLMNEDLKGGETELLQFTVNRIDRSMFGAQMPPEWSGEEASGFTEPKAGAAIAGLMRLDDVLVVRANQKPLWLPMPLDEAVAPVVHQRRRLYETRRDTFAKEQAAFAEWLTPAARAARRADWQRSAASMGAQGGVFLANMESADLAIEKAKRVQYATGGPDERGVKESERELQDAEAVLERLYPEARTAPACYDASASTLAAKFHTVAGASRWCVPLVKTNWDYFDRTLPRSEPQILMVSSFMRCFTKESLTTPTRGGCMVNRQLVESMDWTAVRRWIK